MQYAVFYNYVKILTLQHICNELNNALKSYIIAYKYNTELLYLYYQLL
jgi:hypothetical protein